MPDNEKIVIELELKVKELQKDLGKAEKEIKGWSKAAVKNTEEIVSVLKEMKDDLKDLAKHYKETGAAAARASRQQTESSKSAAREQKKLNDELQRTLELVGGGARGGGRAGAGRGGRGRRLFDERGAFYDVRHPFGGGPQGRGMGRIGRTALNIAGGVGGFVLGGMQQAYGTYMQYGAARYGMTGLGTPAAMRRGMRAAGRGRTGVSLGFTPTETAQMAPGVAGATGALGATGVAQQLALAGGFGPGRAGEAVQYMGVMRQAGAEFGGAGNIKARQKEFSKTIALGMESGLEKARLPEFFAGVGSLVRSQFATAAGKVDANTIAKQLAVLGAGGAGFQGARGAQIMGQLDAMIKRPGGGEAGQAVVLQAMGFGKPGGKVNYYDALKKQQKGIRDPSNIRAIMDEVYRQRGAVEAGGADPRNREANMMFAQMSNLSLEQVETLKNIHASNMTSAEKQAEIEKVMKDAEPVDKQALRVSKEGFAGIKKHQAGVEAMQIKVGAKFAGPMMKLQKFQLQMLDHLTDWLPKVIGWLKKIWEGIMTVVRWVMPEDERKKLKDITQEYEKTRKEIEKTKVTSVSEFIDKSDKAVAARDKYYFDKQQQVAKGQGGMMGLASWMAGTPQKNLRMMKAFHRTDPTIQKGERAAMMGTQFQVATADLPGWIQRDPGVIERLRRATTTEEGSEAARVLYGQAVEYAKKRAQQGRRVLTTKPKAAGAGGYMGVGANIPGAGAEPAGPKVVPTRVGHAHKAELNPPAGSSGATTVD
jgi:hypothetical protein